MKLRGDGAPIALQVGLLIALCLFVAQAVALLVLGFSPPPQPQVYRLGEIAAALHDESLEPPLGRPLLRTIVNAPPELPRRTEERGGGRFAGGRGQAALAAVLGLSPDRVRIFRPQQPWLARALAGRATPPPQIRRARDGARDGEGDSARDGDRDGGRRFRFGPQGDPGERLQRLGPRLLELDIVGNFIAAARQDDGRWVVVRPSPDPFPNDWQRKVGLWMLGCLILAAPAGWWFARRITAPIDRFAEAAQRLGRDPHAPPIDLSGPAEIGKAGRAFNEMQGRLKRYVDDRTAMVGAISHDLRTPLSRIRFKLEAKKPDPAAILSDVQQMEAMIASVLAFIRDAGAVARREKLDLLSVVEVVVDDAALVGGAAQIIEAQPLTVEGDALALQRLLANLVGNALKYGGAARVSMSSRDGLAVVEIEDDGPGMAPADLARAFEPFYRSDASRNLDEGGVGLGLAVARSLARAHGGDVELVSRDGGLTARVTLPLA